MGTLYKNSRGLMLIISSPSGAGKTTLTRALIDAEPKSKLSISVTTRPPRHDEINGKDYHFVTKKQYDELQKDNLLLEDAEVFGNYYGTLRKDTEEALSNGMIMVYDIDWKGATQLMKNCKEDVVSIFIMPPSMEILEKRLRNRATDDETVIKRRLAGAKEEMSKRHHYDYVITNHDVAASLAQIQEILSQELVKRKIQ